MWDANVIRQRLIRDDLNNPDGRVPTDPEERKKIRNSNLRDVGFHAANVVASHIPMAAQAVGVVTIIYGGCRVAFGLLGGLGFCSSDATPAKRKAASGLPLIAGGLATCFHIGGVPNTLLGGLTAAELGAAATTAPTADERWPRATTPGG
jgi:hypothetical protein